MRNAALILAAAFIAVGCVRTTPNPATGTVDVDIESPTKTGEDWKTPLAGIGAYAHLSGEANALVADGSTTARVNLVGGTSGARHPWHIHEGRCTSGGAIVGSPSAYPALVVAPDGRASANASIVVALNEGRDYHVNVHESAANMANIIACGNLDD